MELREKQKLVAAPPQSGKSSCVSAAYPYRGGAACRRGSEASPSGDSKGRSPWRAFGDFRRETKVTRVPSMARPCSRGAPPRGECRGAAPLAYRARRGPRPCKAPEGDRSPPSTYTPKRTKSCTPTCNRQGKNLPSAGKNLRCAVAETRIGRAIMAQQKKRGKIPSLFCCIFEV